MQDQRDFHCYKSHTMHTCSIFAKVHYRIVVCCAIDKYKPQKKVTETLQMYRYPRTVQLEILQMYRIDYLLQRHINSAVREATREHVSKWIGLWSTKYRFGTSRKFCHCIGRDHTTHSFLSLWRGSDRFKRFVVGHIFQSRSCKRCLLGIRTVLELLRRWSLWLQQTSPKRSSKSEIPSNNVA